MVNGEDPGEASAFLRVTGDAEEEGSGRSGFFWLVNTLTQGLRLFQEEMSNPGGLVTNRGRRFKWAIELSGPSSGSR